MMKTRIFITLISFSFLFLLINGCGKNEEKSGHSSFSGGGGGDMNFEQQALKMEQDDLAKLKQGQGYRQADHDYMKGQDFAKIHEGIVTKKDPNEVIATVNGEDILRLELDMILDKVKGKVSRSRLHNVEKQILDDLITQLLLKQFIKKEGIHVELSRIENEIGKFRANLKKNPNTKDKSLETLLEEQGGSVEELRVALDISFSIDDYLDKAVTEEEIKEYFTNNTGSFNGETVTASHILIDTRNIKEEEELDEAKKKVEKIKEELDQGADFVKLAAENSDCPSAKTGGQLGTFGRSEMVKEFTDTAFAMDINNISEPVKTQFGYHIIKVTDKQEGKDVTFEDLKDRVKIALYNEKTVNLIQELTKNADTQILLKETPYTTGSAHGGAGGHGSMSSSHGEMSGGHGASYGASPHWSMPSGPSPHGNIHKKEDGSSEKKVEESFSLTN